MKNDPHWIEHANLKKGALKNTARKEGLIGKGQKVTQTVATKLAGSSNKTTAKRGQLAKTLLSLHKGK